MESGQIIIPNICHLTSSMVGHQSPYCSPHEQAYHARQKHYRQITNIQHLFSDYRYRSGNLEIIFDYITDVWKSWKSGFPDSRMSGIPKIQTSGIPKIRKFRNSGIPNFRNSGKSGIRKIRNSGNPDFRKSGFPDFWISGSPDIQKSGYLDIRISGLQIQNPCYEESITITYTVLCLL